MRRVPPMPLGLAGARPGAGAGPPAAARAARGLPRPPELAAGLQVGRLRRRCWRGCRRCSPRSRSAPTSRRTARAYWQLRALARGVDRYLAVSRDIAARADRAARLAGGEGRGRLQRRRRRALRRSRRRRGCASSSAAARPARWSSPRRGSTSRRGTGALLEAIAEVPEALFALAGDGPERAALEARAERARGRRPGPLPRPPQGRPAAARRLRRLRPALALRGLLAGGAGGDGGGEPGRLLGDRRHRRADRGRPQRPAGAARRRRRRWPAALRRVLADGELRESAGGAGARAGRRRPHPRADGEPRHRHLPRAAGR